MKDFLVTPKRDSVIRLAFVLPTKNEQESIEGVISGLKGLGRENSWDFQIVLSDDSTDKTREIAARSGATVIDGGGTGLGAAVILGIRQALRENPDWIITMDTDGQVDLSEIPFFLETALQEKADLVISSRFLGGRRFEYKYPYLNWIGNRILVGILFLATGRNFSDSHGGIRVIRATLAEKFSLMGKHTYVQETLILSHRLGAKIIELPSKWKVRRFGKSRVLNSISRYVCRTLPALCYLMYFHYGFAAVFLYGLFLFQKSGSANLNYVFLSASSLILSLGIFSRRFYRLKVS